MLRLKVISPEKILFDGDVESVTVPGTLGEFEVLENHAPIISSLNAGKMMFVVPNEGKMEINIAGGLVEVQKNEVSLSVEV